MKLTEFSATRYEAPELERPSVRSREPGAILNTLVKRSSFLRADGQLPTPLEKEALLDGSQLLDIKYLEAGALVSRAVGRIVIPKDGSRELATGFLVGPGILLTNHHVLPTPDIASMARVEFNYRYSLSGDLLPPIGFDLDPSFHYADEALDYAFVGVSPVSRDGKTKLSDFGYLRLVQESGKAKPGEFVTIIQHPDGDPLQIALRENEVTKMESDDPMIWYRADTAHGSSGSPVFNDSFQIVALHSSGRIKRTEDGSYRLKDGSAVRSVEGIPESKVLWEANVGTRVSVLCADVLAKMDSLDAPAAAHRTVLAAAMKGGDILSTSLAKPVLTAVLVEKESLVAAEVIEKRPSATPTVTTTKLGGGVVVRVEVDIPAATVSSEPAAAVSGAAVLSVRPDLELEKWAMQVPIIYDSLETRDGYDENFLDDTGAMPVPLPKLTAAGRKVAALLLDGSGHLLNYHKFTIAMHKGRRLAIFTAANVDWNKERHLVNGKKPNRMELTGLPDKVLEQWVTDPRISPDHQLSDAFYTDDDQAFDKGHLVRRDDVCWGDDFEDIQMANGDTYHITNCSPQINTFNQGSLGEDNWGDLESLIQKVTNKEKVCILSGPVLRATDRHRQGVMDDGSMVRVRIPESFWKIVVAKGETQLETYGFKLYQDTTSVTEKELLIPLAWKSKMVPLSEIRTDLRGWVALNDLEQFDKYEAS